MSTVNIASLCRVCVNPSYYHANVFNKLTLDGDRLFETINTICQLDLIEGDGLPEYICKECDFKLSEIEVFKQSCRKGRRKLLALKNEEIGECIANEDGTLGCCGSDEIDIEEHHPGIKTERLDEENERGSSEEYDDNDHKYSSTNKSDIEPPNNAVAQANVKLEENVSMFDCQKEEESLVDVGLIQQHEVFIKVEPFVFEQCIDESTPYQETGDNIQNYTQFIHPNTAVTDRKKKRGKYLRLSDKRRKNLGGKRLRLWRLAQKELAAKNMNTPVQAPDDISWSKGSPDIEHNFPSEPMIEQPGICHRECNSDDPLETEESSDEEVSWTRGLTDEPHLEDREEDMKNMTIGVTCVRKQEFGGKLSKYLKNKPERKIWSKNYIQKVITVLNESKVDEENGKELSTHQIHYRTLYDTRETCTGIRLFYRKCRWEEFIIPYEEYYDILLECHAKTFHGDANTLLDVLGKETTIPKKVLVMFVNSCGFHRDRMNRLCEDLPPCSGDTIKGKYKLRKHLDVWKNCETKAGSDSVSVKKDADPEWLPKYFL